MARNGCVIEDTLLILQGLGAIQQSIDSVGIMTTNQVVGGSTPSRRANSEGRQVLPLELISILKVRHMESTRNSEFIRNIPLDIIITILTCGLFNFYIQYRQCLALNHMLKENKYSFLMWLIFTILTCGLYHLYHEYRMSSDLSEKLHLGGANEPLVVLLLAVFAMPFVGDAIQQSHINAYYGHTDL